jgi:hypothetical protein
VVVDVRGEDDGTADRVVVGLQMIGWGNDAKERWLLGELPPELGKHELEVRIPTGLAPACSRYAEYSFTAELVRTKGMSSDAASIVDVIARPEDLWWPEGPRSGGDAPVAIVFDEEVVALGGPLTGRVVLQPVVEGRRPGKVEVSVGPVVDTLVQVAGKSQPQPRARFSAAAEVALDAGQGLELPFRFALPEGLPPTLHNGGQTTIAWQVRVKHGKTAAWAVVGVVDPEASAGRRNAPSPSLLSFLASLDTQR